MSLMPVSPRLSHVDAVQAVMLDIERRQPSIEDLYRMGLSTMANALDVLHTQLTEEPGVPGRYIVSSLESLLGKVSSALRTTTPPARTSTPGLGVSQADLVLAAYGAMRDGVSSMYANHLGGSHSGQCLICQCLARCAAIVDGTERTLTRYMKQAAADLKSVHSGVPTHKATPVSAFEHGVQLWLVTCPTCGVLQRFPINQTQSAARLAIRHRRERVAHSRALTSGT